MTMVQRVLRVVMPRKKTMVREVAVALDTRSIQASTFKATCLELMDEIAARHTEIVVTKHGRPVVRVGPVDPTPPSPFGFLRSTIVGQEGIVDPEHEAWRESVVDPLDEDGRI
jgi:prevent-host-death family protein